MAKQLGKSGMGHGKHRKSGTTKVSTRSKMATQRLLEEEEEKVHRSIKPKMHSSVKEAFK